MRKLVSGLRFLMTAALIILLCGLACAQAEAAPNPLISPQRIEYVRTENEYFNVLLVGIDLGREDYLGSFGKRELEQGHADAMLVASLNMDTGDVNLISLPRDTLTYVPGVRGIYKLNGALNCGETVKEGLESACAAASWLLGGVEVSQYCAIDMNTMIELGDAIGGVEFEMDMSYTGSSGRRYQPGLQHMDGMAIMDYLRARKNATRDGTDLGRTGRQRSLMLAIFKKLRDDPALVTKVISILASPEKTLMTNIGIRELITLAPSVLKVQPENIGSYVMTGTYITALDGWNFTFTDQDNRRELIGNVFSIDVPDLPYVSRAYCDWLEEYGFTTLRYLRTAQSVLEYAQESAVAAELSETIRSLEDEIERVEELFEAAAAAQDSRQTNAMATARAELREKGEALAEAVGGKTFYWSARAKWFEDPKINEYQFRWE